SALLLLTGAGLLTRTIIRMARFDPGYEVTNLLRVETSLPADRYPDAQRKQLLVQRLMARLAAVPGVRLVGAMAFEDNSLRISASEGGIAVEGQSDRLPASQSGWPVQSVTPGYFQVL